MLQRKQSLFFLLAIINLGIPLFGYALFSVYEKQKFIDASSIYDGISLVAQKSDNWLWILNLACLFAVLTTVFAYKNRKNQLRMAWIALFLVIFLPIFMWWDTFSFVVSYTMQNLVLKTHFAFYFYFLNPIFVYLGLRGIKNDIALIDSLNRLR